MTSNNWENTEWTDWYFDDHLVKVNFKFDKALCRLNSPQLNLENGLHIVKMLHTRSVEKLVLRLRDVWCMPAIYWRHCRRITFGSHDFFFSVISFARLFPVFVLILYYTDIKVLCAVSNTATDFLKFLVAHHLSRRNRLTGIRVVNLLKNRFRISIYHKYLTRQHEERSFLVYLRYAY